MAQQQSPPETEAATSEEAAPVVEGEDASAAGAAAADTGAPAGEAAAVETSPAEGEPKPELTEEEKAAEAAKAAEAETALKAAAEKYAKEQIAQANRTMAAARRAERIAKETAERTTAELTAAKREAETYGGFVKQLQTEPMTALARLGFTSFKHFAEFVAEHGGEAKPQSEEERIAALVDKKLEEREAPRKQAEKAKTIEESKKVVFAHIDAQTDRYDLCTTDVGHERIWKEIESYHRQHGVVPDEAVALIADAVEKQLAASLSKTKRFGQSQPAKNGTTATGTAAAGASKSSASLAGKPTSGAPAPKKYSLNSDERSAQINEELRAEGIL